MSTESTGRFLGGFAAGGRFGRFRSGVGSARLGLGLAESDIMPGVYGATGPVTQLSGKVRAYVALWN